MDMFYFRCGKYTMSVSILLRMVVLCISMPLLSCASIAGVIEDIEKDLEQKRMVRLSAAKRGATIKAFTSDGCSGGLSTGWEYFADKFPGFASRFGDQPPWQQCCVTHDRAYWQGVTDNGFEARRQADLALKTCVENTGVDIQQTREDVSLSLKITAQLMYRAVRLGGKPCSLFSWRWGYGWPLCAEAEDEED